MRDVTDESVTIACEIYGAKEYEFRIVDEQSGQTKSQKTTSTSHTFENLRPNRDFRYQVRIHCNMGRSEWREGSFTTLHVCHPPGENGLKEKNVTHHSTVLKCIRDESQYQFRYREHNQTGLIWKETVPQTTDTIGLINLRPETKYLWQCRVLCDTILVGMVRLSIV